MLQEYLKILGVEENTQLAEVKRAYRNKAKIYHPDINKSPDAHEKFILLNEAYEYLLNYKSGKLTGRQQQRNSGQQNKRHTSQDWQKTYRAKARARAQHHAKMRYEAFVKTEFYKNTVALGVISEFLSVIATVIIFLSPVIGWMIYDMKGALGGLAFIFVTVHFWADILFNRKLKIRYTEIVPSIKRIVQTRTFIITLAALLNLFLILRVTLSTVVSVDMIAIVYSGTIGIAFFLCSKYLTKKTGHIVTFAVTPSVVNLFFLINFMFTSNETVETYDLVYYREDFTSLGQYSAHNRQRTTLVRLHGDKYDEEVGIRLFFDFEQMKYAQSITYNFAEGSLGLKVMKSYRFH